MKAKTEHNPMNRAKNKNIKKKNLSNIFSPYKQEITLRKEAYQLQEDIAQVDNGEWRARLLHGLETCVKLGQHVTAIELFQFLHVAEERALLLGCDDAARNQILLVDLPLSTRMNQR
jgi:hypothetical protein